MKYLTISPFAAKGAIYSVTIAAVRILRVKITCYFHVGRYHVFAEKLTWYFFHWCLYNKIQFNTIRYATMRCDAVRCDAMRCDAMRCNAMQCNAMQCNTIQYKIQYNTIQYNTLQYNIIYFSHDTSQWLTMCMNRDSDRNEIRNRLTQKMFRLLNAIVLTQF